MKNLHAVHRDNDCEHCLTISFSYHITKISYYNMKHVNAVTDQKGLAQKYPSNLYWFLRWYFLAKAL